MSAPGPGPEAPGAAPSPRRVEPSARGTSGGLQGTNGEALRRGALFTAVSALGIAALVTVNIFSRLHDQPSLQGGDGPWRVLVDEITAGVTAALLVPIALLLLWASPPGRGRWLPFAAVQAAGALAFAVLHVTAFVLLRKGLYAGHGLSYVFGGPTDALYEFRKDAFAYALGLTLAALADTLMRRELPTAHVPAPTAEAAPPVLIRDGQRTLRLSAHEIVAVQAAGNYVEWRLTDGRRPLERATMAEIEARLAVCGFVRTHRSWLVNPAAVREIAPSTSGDRQLTLTGGLQAPVSRRYADAVLAAIPGVAQ